MTMQHPDEKHLQGYVAARLADGQEKIIEKHLARCPQCSKRVSELENSLEDPLLQKVKAAASSSGDDSSEIVAAVVRSSRLNQSVSNVLIAGDILGGNLRLEEKLGRGGMGETWKAYDQTAGRYVVLKFVPGEMQHLTEAMDSVRSSFQKIHALQHQHICPVYSLVDDPKHGLYIVMKYIDGMTMREYRRRLADKKTKLSLNDIVQVLWAVAKGLDYAHEQKVIHRDIKPGNIMIGKKDGVQIIDFGLAEEIRTIMSQASDSVGMSSSGTRPYMAPEQWQGRIQDARTDQYALAVTAYELFAGHVPFSGNDIDLLKNTVLNDLPEPIAGLSEYVNAALLKALSKKREDRYENCKSFVKALAIKPETSEGEKFPAGGVAVNDLPSDRASGEKAPPVWLPDGLLSPPPSMPMPPIITTDTASKKKTLPSWVLPTISALAMLAVCLIGYVMLDRHPKPENRPAVAKKVEQEEEPVAEPEKIAVEEPQPIVPPFKSDFEDIFEAANKGTVKDIEYFLKNGTNINAKTNDSDSCTPLHEAARSNSRVDVFEYLISQGADISARNRWGSTPLGFAAANNANVEVLKYLVSQQANINARNNDGRTLLLEAAWFNKNLEIMKYLVSLGPDLNAQSKGGCTPLYYAAQKNRNVEILRYLISIGADVNVKDKSGKTPLDVADTEEKKTILREAGGKIGTEMTVSPPMVSIPPSPAGFKDIFEAAKKGTVQDVEYFVKNGIDVNVKNKAANTPLHNAAQYNPDAEVLKYLISQGANVNAKSVGDLTPLHFAAQFNSNVEVLKCLLSQKADVNAKMKIKGNLTPLDLANTEEKKTILREAGAKSGTETTEVSPPVEPVAEPVEAVELRRKFEEAVKQAQTPYREELEKELALVKKKDDAKLVAALEAEQKHLDSENGTELTVFTPEKRSLLNAKVRYKKQLETARDAYLKGMDLLVKELVRNARTDDSVTVQKTLDRLRSRLDERSSLNEPKFSLIAPKRSPVAPVPVIRMTMELHANGKGRCGVSTGMSTDAPEPLFPSSPFPLSAFSKAQAFRGQNGMGRVVWDFRDADPLETWDVSGWNHTFRHAIIDTQRKTLRFESSKNGRPSLWPGKFSDFPFRLTVEAVVNPKGYCPLIHFCLNTRSGEQTYVDLWRPADASLTDKFLISQYTRIYPDGSRSNIRLAKTELVGNQPVWSFFELPKTAVENIVSVHCDVQAGHEQYISPPPIALDVEVVLLDISGKLKATTGLAVVQTGEKTTVNSVSLQTSAFRAGLKQGDEIVRFNGEKRSAEQIQQILEHVQFGDPISVAVVRNGEEKVFRLHAE